MHTGSKDSFPTLSRRVMKLPAPAFGLSLRTVPVVCHNRLPRDATGERFMLFLLHMPPTSSCLGARLTQQNEHLLLRARCSGQDTVLRRPL